LRHARAPQPLDAGTTAKWDGDRDRMGQPQACRATMRGTDQETLARVAVTKLEKLLAKTGKKSRKPA
jgi:hypothetical protein